MYCRSGLASLAFSLLLFLTFSAQCADPARVQPAATGYIVSGSVTAPGGVIAAHDSAQGFSLARLLEFFVTPAQAGVAGLLPVPNGTRVELVRLGNRGFTSAPIAVTTTQYGRYRFNLSALRLTILSRLGVRVGNVGTGEQMRAVVSGMTVDINPVSEAAVQMVLHSIATSPNGTLPNFTLRELQDLTRSLDLLTSVNRIQAADNILSSVTEIRNSAAADAGIMRFLAAAAFSGQTNIGPGDIGNFFPFARGQSWTYTVRETEDDIARTPYTTTETITGTQIINGVATTVFRNSNSDGDGKVDYDFIKKTSAGVFDWEPVKDGQMTRPHQFVRFPATPGSSFSQSLGNMGMNSDLDGDGVVERFSFTVNTTAVGLETVYVPAGALPDTLKIRSVVNGYATVSSTQKRVTVTITAVEWYTRNLGLSRQMLVSRTTYNGRVWTDSRTQVLTGVGGFPFTGEFPFDRQLILDVDSNDVIYDSISGKLFAGARSSAANYANNVVVIDPNSGALETAIPVGNNPGALAVSGDGQFLYVGLGADGEHGSIRQVSIPTLTAEAEWQLSDEVFQSGFVVHHYARDIDVLPGHPEVISVVSNTEYTDGSSSGVDVRLLNNGAEHVALQSGFHRLYFGSDPNVAYGHRSTGETVLAVTPDDMTVSQVRHRTSSAVVRCFLNDKFFMSTGEIINAADGAHIGDIPFAPYTTPYSGDADPATSQVAFVHEGSNGDTIQVFDVNTLAKTDEIFVPLEYYKQRSKFAMVRPGLYALQIRDTWSNNQRRVILIKRGTAH